LREHEASKALEARMAARDKALDRKGEAGLEEQAVVEDYEGPAVALSVFNDENGAVRGGMEGDGETESHPSVRGPGSTNAGDTAGMVGSTAGVGGPVQGGRGGVETSSEVGEKSNGVEMGGGSEGGWRDDVSHSQTSDEVVRGMDTKS